jgi:hypothetical protein
VAVFVVLYLLEPTSDAALLFYRVSMWLAAARGYAGCELLAVSNWLLRRRPDRLRGLLAHRPAGAAPNHPAGHRLALATGLASGTRR